MASYQRRLLKRVRKALGEVHQSYLLEAMQNGDEEYADTMNSMFVLLKRLEEGLADE